MNVSEETVGGANKKFLYETQVRDRHALFLLHGKFNIVLCENNGFGQEIV